MTEENGSSPEEKLLRVIRSGTKPAASADDSAAAATAAGGIAAAARPGSGTSPPDTGDTAPPPPERSARKTGRRTGFVTPAIRLLVIAALLLIALAVWDVWGGFHWKAEAFPVVVRADSEILLPETTVATAELPPLDDMLNRFREQPLFMVAERVERPEEEPVERAPDEWQRYAETNLRLLGLSVLDAETEVIEAIVADRQTGDLHYLTPGDRMLVAGTRVTIDQVAIEQVVLTDGVRRVVLQ